MLLALYAKIERKVMHSPFSQGRKVGYAVINVFIKLFNKIITIKQPTAISYHQGSLDYRVFKWDLFKSSAVKLSMEHTTR